MLDLESAIKHCEEVAEENEIDAEQFKRFRETQDMISHCYECAEEHRQLAEWLRELKKLREEQRNVYMNGYDEGYERGHNDGVYECLMMNDGGKH